MKQRLLSRLWEPIGAKIAKLGYPHDRVQRNANGYKGVFAIIDRSTEDYWELMTLKEIAPHHYELKPNLDQCQAWEIDSETATRIASAASQ